METDGSDGGKTMHMYLISDNGNLKMVRMTNSVVYNFTTIKKISFNWLHILFHIKWGNPEQIYYSNALLPIEISMTLCFY